MGQAGEINAAYCYLAIRLILIPSFVIYSLIMTSPQGPAPGFEGISPGLGPMSRFVSLHCPLDAALFWFSIDQTLSPPHPSI